MQEILLPAGCRNCDSFTNANKKMVSSFRKDIHEGKFYSSPHQLSQELKKVNEMCEVFKYRFVDISRFLTENKVNVLYFHHLNFSFNLELHECLMKNFTT